MSKADPISVVCDLNLEGIQNFWLKINTWRQQELTFIILVSYTILHVTPSIGLLTAEFSNRTARIEHMN